MTASLFAPPAAVRVAFQLEQRPVKQGDMRSLGTGRPMVHANAKQLKPYRDALHITGRAAMHGQEPTALPVMVRLIFTLPRPKTVTRPLPTGHQDGDLDKYIRACLDALTGAVYVDDALVVQVTARKLWPGQLGGLPVPGVQVGVWTVAE